MAARWTPADGHEHKPIQIAALDIEDQHSYPEDAKDTSRTAAGRAETADTRFVTWSKDAPPDIQGGCVVGLVRAGNARRTPGPCGRDLPGATRRNR